MSLQIPPKRIFYRFFVIVSGIENYIDVTFHVKKSDDSLPAKGVVEVFADFRCGYSVQVMVVKDEVFDTIGIEENNLHYYCCDDQAFDVRV